VGQDPDYSRQLEAEAFVAQPAPHPAWARHDSTQPDAQAAQAGDVDTKSNLGALYANGNGANQDYKQALFWYQKAAAADDAVTDGNIARIYQYGEGVQKSDAQVMAYYKQGATLKTHGSADDEYNFGHSIYKIKITRLTPSIGSADAQDLLGRQYLTGMAVGGKDDSQAMHWFTLASSNGSSDAKKHIGLIYLLGDGIKQDDQQAVQRSEEGTQDSAP
jgi:TPR repeat protein